MTREEVICMAREAGVYSGASEMVFAASLERFAARAAEWGAKQEREACAKVCEPQSAHDDPLTAWKIAAAIRERGEVKP